MGGTNLTRAKQLQETKQTELLMSEIYSILPFFFLYFILAAEKLDVIADLRPNNQFWKCLLH